MPDWSFSTPILILSPVNASARAPASATAATVTSSPSLIVPRLPRIPSAFHQRAAALAERAERPVGRDGGPQLVVVPRILRFGGRLHLHDVHVVQRAAVRADAALAEERVIGRQLLHRRDHLPAVAVLAQRLQRLKVV